VGCAVLPCCCASTAGSCGMLALGLLLLPFLRAALTFRTLASTERCMDAMTQHHSRERAVSTACCCRQRAEKAAVPCSG
jgi:hypothetical protein